MAPNLFVVKFDKPDATYQPGETITGCVIIELDEDRSCRDLRIAVKGFAYVHWTESDSETDMDGKSQSKTNHYSATERYFDFQQPLIHKSRADEELILPAGRSEYRFVYQLPTNIPCSFEHTFGHIRYTMKAVVDMPWRFDWWAKAAFTVVTPFDLNDIEHQCVPIDDEKVKTYSCCCFDSGSIYARVKILGTGYVPGQTIDIDLSFDLKSLKIDVSKISAVLEQEITFYAEGRTKKASIALKKAQYDGPFDKSGRILLKLYVPPVPPSNLLPCDIIQVDYRVLARVHVDGMHRKLERSYPIIIGTSPLRSAMWSHRPDDMRPRPSAPTDPSGNKVAPYPVDAPGMIQPGEGSTNPIGWTMPLPTYEECMHHTSNIKDSDDKDEGFGADNIFSPRYPVFNFSFPPSAPKQ